MKITIEHYDITHSIELPDDSGLDTFMRAVKTISLSVGYNSGQIKEWFNDPEDNIQYSLNPEYKDKIPC